MATSAPISVRPYVATSVMLMICGCGDTTTKPPAPSRPAVKKLATKTAKPSMTDAPTVEQLPPVSITEHPPAQMEVTPAPVFRPDDERPRFDDAALAVLGIHRYESRRLRLYTDIPAEDARSLPAVIDAAYDTLSADFGALPPSRRGDDFQMTGYLMQDEKRFREAGMIPDDLPPIDHGRHYRNQFWLREQPYDYYRRHLLIHEATHCVMTYLPENQAPVWYLEGMAELFGTHRIASDGKIHFDVMPTSPEEFAGFGRITLIQDAVKAERTWTISEVLSYPAAKYLDPEPYAWTWALCYFLKHHPRYSTRFHELARNQQPRAFQTVMETLLTEGGRDLVTEWGLFAANLQYGFDVSRAAISFQRGLSWTDKEARTAEVVADRGWQSTKCLLKAGQRYEITATGMFTLAQQPKPWISEADGISFRYFQGIPLGKLLAWVHNEEGDPQYTVLPIGSRGEITVPVTGTLYLRFNDSWSELADNTGSVSVSVRPIVD